MCLMAKYNFEGADLVDGVVFVGKDGGERCGRDVQQRMTESRKKELQVPLRQHF